MGVVNSNDIMANCLHESEQQIALTGILDVDAGMLLSKRNFTLIAGVSGVGKTDFLLNIAKYNAAKGKRILYINLKNSIEELSIRLFSIDSGVPMKNIIQKQMTEDEWESIIQRIENSKNDKVLFYNINKGYMELKNIMTEIEISNADMVILDDIQIIEDEGNRYMKERIEAILKNIKTLGIRLSIPIIGAYSIPRKASDSRSDHRPMMEDVEYNGLMSYPDNIAFLYREQMYNTNSENKSMGEIIIVKNIFGDIFTVNMVYVNGKFANLEKNE